MSYIEKVKEFHQTFDHPVLNLPTIPDEGRCALRVSLIQEELDELNEAIKSKDIVGVLDALCDIQYVLAGAVLEFGMGDIFEEGFNEVHRSNMSKACNSKNEAQATVEHYHQNHQTLSYVKEKSGKYLVYRADDNKTLKSINYSPANLEEVLNVRNNRVPRSDKTED